MKVYDTANQLAKEIRESEEYIAYKQAKEDIMATPELKKKVEDFEALRYEVQLLQMQGQESGEEKTKKLQEMYMILIQEKDIKDYFDKEVKFNVMIADMNKIIAESIADVL